MVYFQSFHFKESCRMNNRADYYALAPAAANAMLALEKAVANASIEPSLCELVKIRASQINGCLFCLDMHSKSAKKAGERELRLCHLPLWRESPLFSAREKAALEWTETLTRPGKHGATDEDYQKLAAHFSEKEIVDLTFVISTINAWNRLGVAFRNRPGAMDKMLGLENVMPE